MVKRREFLAELAAAGAAIGAMFVVPTPICPAVVGTRSAVVSIHMDQPYIDKTGKAIPYHPPRGMRSGAVVERLSEEAFRRMQCYA
jgi:hypothetical protein